MTPELLIDDLVLRPLTMHDAPVIHRLVNDWSVVRMLSRLPFPYPRELADQWITRAIADGQQGAAHHFAITRNGAVLGAVGLVLSDNRRTATFGYWMAPAFWGQGIMTRAARRVVDWAFDELGLLHLTADVSVDNPASATVLRKLGFCETGRSARRFVSRGQECPVIVLQHHRGGVTPGIDSNRTGPDRSGLDGNAPGATPARPRAEAAPSPLKARTLLVVAAALIDRQERLLLARRPEGKHLAGLWEFPGGKVEPNEAPEQALVREMREELGLDLHGACLSPFTFVSANAGGFHLLMPLYVVRRWRGTPSGREGQELAWVHANDLANYPMPDPDVPLIPLLKELLA